MSKNTGLVPHFTRIKKEIVKWEKERDSYSSLGLETEADRCQKIIDELYYVLWQ